MADLDSALAATLSRTSGETWLGRYAHLDWGTTGIPRFEHWDPALASAARIVPSQPHLWR